MTIIAQVARRHPSGTFIVEVSGDELARCLCFENDAERLRMRGQRAFEIGDIVPVEIQPQATETKGAPANEDSRT